MVVPILWWQAVRGSNARRLRSAGSAGAWVCMADGSVRFLPESISREELEALLTIAGAEPVDLNNLAR